MAAVPPPLGAAPVLQKPPGFRDPSVPTQPPRPLPPKRPLPPSFRPDTRKHYRRSRCSCGRCFCCTLLVLLIILCAIGFLGAAFYLYFQPKAPSFHLQAFNATRFVVSVKTDGTFLDATVNAHIQSTNPNGKIELSYKQGDVQFVAVDNDAEVDLGSSTFPAFRQATKNSTVVKVTTQVKHVMVDDSVGTKLKSKFQSKELNFRVDISTKLGVRIKGKTIFKLPTKISCGKASLKQINHGSLPKCSVTALKWIKLS